MDGWAKTNTSCLASWRSCAATVLRRPPATAAREVPFVAAGRAEGSHLASSSSALAARKGKPFSEMYCT